MGLNSRRKMSEYVKVKRPIELIRLKEKNPAATTRAAPLLLFHCLRTLCLCAHTYICVCV